MNVAVLDLGTNVFHLLIAEIQSDKSYKILYRDQIGVKLREGIDADNKLTKTAFGRALKAVKTFSQKIKAYKADQVQAVGTSAIRSAPNTIILIETIYQETGIDIQHITGEREAELIYKGIKLALGNFNVVSLIVDIGGGSVECILCDANGILWKKSYEIGAARLMEKFHQHDPILTEEITTLENYLADELQELTGKITQYQPQQLIGSAGAFETWAVYINTMHRLNQLPLQKPSYRFNYEFLFDALNFTIQSTHSERKNMPGMIPVRTDMIVSAAVLTRLLLQQTTIREVILSTYSLKEGLLSERLERT